MLAVACARCMEPCTCRASAWRSRQRGRWPWPGRRRPVAEPRAADGVAPSDLGSYQYAVRLVLANDLITAARPRAGALASVLRWADLIARDFAELLGYTLIATAHQVRLLRRLDTLDATQRSVFAARSGRPFDRRRLSYMCLVLAVFQRSRIEISLADLVRAFAPTAAALRGTELADNLARLTGLVVERRAEGVMLVDPTGRFTDQPFPGRGGAVNRTAGLLLAKIADVLEDPDDGQTVTRLPVPAAADGQRSLLGRIDAGRPDGPSAEEPAAVRLSSGPASGVGDPAPDSSAPLIEQTRLAGMLAGL